MEEGFQCTGQGDEVQAAGTHDLLQHWIIAGQDGGYLIEDETLQHFYSWHRMACGCTACGKKHVQLFISFDKPYTSYSRITANIVKISLLGKTVKPNLLRKNEDPVKYRLILDPNMMAEELLDQILQASYKNKTNKTNPTVLLTQVAFLPEGDLPGLTLGE
ncbi:hypothetical protein AV530_016251 [Patagioenas fasciata monilis]|uniref:Uncharacterized protein n=1 Tax=Patagioenas fasciata monilis TaxID=372326 RepID=A0A1V4JWZ1_PATFA|nr:hypothetical protein AV530_016251 [Patagioenas fasciata monilis]